MPAIDHLIIKVNEVPASVDFYVNVLGFELESEDGPFTVIRINEDLIDNPLDVTRSQRIS